MKTDQQDHYENDLYKIEKRINYLNSSSNPIAYKTPHVLILDENQVQSLVLENFVETLSLKTLDWLPN